MQTVDVFSVPSPLPNDPATLRQVLLAAVAEIERLRLQIAGLQRNRFGRRSEQLDDETLQQGVEDLEQSVAEQAAGLEVAGSAAQPATKTPEPHPPRSKPAQRNRGALPPGLPRVEVTLDIEDKTCPCCGGPLHRIGDDRSEMLDYVPAHFRVRAICRPRYGCRTCTDGVLQAPAPDRPIDGGLATEALLAHVLINKYSDHLPLYRQAQIFARQGIRLDRSTLCTWVGRACWWLEPLHALMLDTVLASPRVFADDTTLPVLDPGRGRTKTGRLWCYAVDNRPWCGPGHPAVTYLYSEDRKAQHPAAHLKGFRGLLQVDGYAGFGRLVTEAADAPPQLAFCWAHVRRKFYDIHVANQSPIAAEALRHIAALYELEADIRGRPAEQRRLGRQQCSRPLVEAMHAWLTEQLERLFGRSTLAAAIRYALRHWPGLILFLDDGRLELDTNTVERAIRPVTLGRKNALFAGADSGGRHWAMIATLIQSAKLNDVEPLAWLTDVLERIVSGHTKHHQLDTLLPWNWAAAKAGEAPDTA
jgi:transposase